jgi:excisionase family DNA binding protein
MPEWLTTEEAAAYLKVSRKTLFNYMRDGRLPWYSIPAGRGRRIQREDLDKLLQRGRPNDVER